ncbi:MAG: hypothetical protein KBC38_02355 [Candidatus Pacebacteria bacterium]|nr:hypothetical protein [Candidatus Paceibacterota bacterium]MBP9840633.1 hypothetical protein [Candidatus Paceibacterota bacterium]
MARATSVLALITSRLAALDPANFVEPDYVPDESDHKVEGVFPDDLKRLFTLREHLREEYNALVQKAQAFAKSDAPDATEKEALLGSLERGKKLYELVTAMFWEDVNRTFPEVAPKNAIAIGVGWTVHWSDPKPTSDLGSLLSRLVGGAVEVVVVGPGKRPFG